MVLAWPSELCLLLRRTTLVRADVSLGSIRVSIDPEISIDVRGIPLPAPCA